TRVLAVHLHRAQENKAADESGTGLGEPDRRVAIDAPQRAPDAARSVCDCGKVDDGADAVEECASIEFCGDIRNEDLMQPGGNRMRRDQTPYRGADRVSAREHLAAKGGADEARCTSDEDAHVEPRGKGAAFPLSNYAGF